MLLYDEFSDFEIIQLLLILREHPLTTIGFEKGYVKSIGQLKIYADISIDEFNTNEADLFIIPGGEPKNFIRNKNYSMQIGILNKKLLRLANDKKIIACRILTCSGN